VKWFSDHAPAIQAFASISGLIVAAVLAWLTGRYVYLTREIANSSLQQVQHLKDAARLSHQQNSRALWSLALRIRVSLAELDAAIPKHRQLRGYSLITTGDIVDMEALSRQIGGDAVVYAAKAAMSLRFILGLIEKAKSVNETTGWMASEDEVKKWKAAMEMAPQMLGQLEQTSSSIAAV
jgi:hypothetical protein